MRLSLSVYTLQFEYVQCIFEIKRRRKSKEEKREGGNEGGREGMEEGEKEGGGREVDFRFHLLPKP